MARSPRLSTTFLLIALTGAALFLGARWSFASPRIDPIAPLPRPKLPPVIQPRLDVAFVLDTTGSMADEIAVVKDKIADIARGLQAGQPRPDVRFALVCYRDRGDAYVTQTFPFTRDIDALQRTLREVTADGGGDTPESVNAALHAAVADLAWDRAAYVTKQIFLIGDAGPHMDYPQDQDYHQTVRAAAVQRIAIDAISCSGMDGFGTNVWQEVAKATNGRFEYLTYARAMVQPDGSVKTYLEAGDRTYEPADEVSETEWRKSGAAGLLRSDKAAPVAPSAVGGVQRGEVMNTLDDVMLERLKDRAVEEQGVVYHSD